MLKLIWTCDECGKEIKIEAPKISDSYEVYHPDGVNWHAKYDKEGNTEEEQELCDECHAKWFEKTNREDPGPWMA